MLDYNTSVPDVWRQRVEPNGIALTGRDQSTPERGRPWPAPIGRHGPGGLYKKNDAAGPFYRTSLASHAEVFTLHAINKEKTKVCGVEKGASNRD